LTPAHLVLDDVEGWGGREGRERGREGGEVRWVEEERKKRSHPFSLDAGIEVGREGGSEGRREGGKEGGRAHLPA